MHTRATNRASERAEADCAWVFTTNPGLERIVCDEFEERAGKAGAAGPAAIKGRVRARAPAAVMAEVAPAMRSIHHVLRPVHAFELNAAAPLAQIHAEVGALDIPEMDGAASFRVTTKRRGKHDFHSQDVMREAGAALNARWNVPVDLESFETEIRVDVLNHWCSVDVALTHTPLSNRHPRLRAHPAALRPNIAYAALRMAGLDHAARLLVDPFCGSGTILMEAAAVWPRLGLEGSDWDRRPLAGAVENLSVAGLCRRARLFHRDAIDLASRYAPGSVDAIVTNPPYGRKLGRAVNYPQFYLRFMESAVEVLRPGGRLVMLADRRGAVRRALRRVPALRQVTAPVIQISGVFPSLFVFKRMED